MDIIKHVQKFAKRNKRFFLTFSCFLLAIVIELSIAYISKIGREINDTSEQVKENTIKIVNVEKSVGFYNGLFRSVVTRASFNDYVKHTDDRFRQEQNTSSEVLRSMGTLDGRITGIERIVYALNLYEIKKKIPVDKKEGAD